MFLRIAGLFALLLSSTHGFAQTPAGNPVVGEDYFVIENASPIDNDNKVDVVEIFSYACPHCADFQTFMEAWQKTKPSDVDFQYLPAAMGSTWDDFARAYYAADAMGIREKSHDALFDALHKERKPIRGLPAIAEFYTAYGVDPKVFEGTMKSFAVNAKVARSKQQTQRWQVANTPSVVVDGKYRVVATRKGFQHMLDTIDFLVAKARTERLLAAPAAPAATSATP